MADRPTIIKDWTGPTMWHVGKWIANNVTSNWYLVEAEGYGSWDQWYRSAPGGDSRAYVQLIPTRATLEDPGPIQNIRASVHLRDGVKNRENFINAESAKAWCDEHLEAQGFLLDCIEVR